MDTKKVVMAIILVVLLGTAATGAAAQRIQGPVRQLSAASPDQALTVERPIQDIERTSLGGRKGFTATLFSGEPVKFILGPCARPGSYVVDVTPLRDSGDGAYIEKSILPEFDGYRWVDALTVLLPSDVPPLKVHVQVYSTAGWPVVFQSTLDLEPGSWQGYSLQDAAVAGGYVIEINPRGSGEPGDRIEKALVQPEFSDTWWDVLRVQIPEGQAPLEAEVIIYQTPPDQPVVMEYEFVAEAGAWYGFGLGDSRAGGAYIVEVTPLVNELSQLERYTVQPEYDGQSWTDVVRVMVSPDWPPMPMRVTVYLAGGG